MPPPESKSPSLEALDFELTDFDTARGALEEPPAGVLALARTAQPDWLALRRPADPAQNRLQAVTLAWMRSVEPRLRPRELIARFPRIANQIASHWADSRRCLRLLGALLLDQRGGRRGFPLGIAAELTALHDHLQARARLQSD